MLNLFFDYTSSTPIDKEILTAYEKTLEKYYINSEALYSDGIEVKKMVETSREKIAKLFGVHKDEIIFTSGASESNNFAIKGYCLKNMHKGKHIITSKMEHSSMMNAIKQLESFFGFEVTYLDINENGCVNVEDVVDAIRDDTIVVSLMAVNNEIGSIQPINEIGKILKEKRICFIVDAVQAISKIELNFDVIDMLSCTTHKLYGIKGCGILYKKRNIELLPLINGGQQEQGLRGGTTNAPAAIVAFKTFRKAFENAKSHYDHVKKLNDYCREELSKIDDIVINSPVNNSIPYILNISCLSVNSEIMMNALNSRGICVSAQSTCASRTKTPSKTLKAMNKSDEIAYGAIRISLSHLHNFDDVKFLVSTIKEIVDEYRT